MSATVRFREEIVPPGTVAGLGLPEEMETALRGALEENAGLVLVAAPAGAGRTTTLYALLAEVDVNERAIVTIEESAFRPLAGVDQVVLDPGAGRTTARVLEDVLRSDPDVVLVDDVADPESAALVARAAWRNLVLATVAAPCATDARELLAKYGIARETLATTTLAVVSQRLLRRICVDCRESYFPTRDELRVLDRPEEEVGRRLLGRGAGCATCSGSGYDGLVGVVAATRSGDRPDVYAASDRAVREQAMRLCLDGVTTVDEISKLVERDH